ncbi:MAG: MG2 domain-containing protein [Cardiobacteriaceae bacterium]|nr:MG2 domain-containing protein [Cardiobacteriaceae bacterium]
MFRKTLIAACITTLSIAHAEQWNADRLAATRSKAEADINQYLQNGSGPFSTLANDEIRAWLAKAQYSSKGGKDFAHLKNRAKLLSILIDNAQNSQNYDDDSSNNKELILRSLLTSSSAITNSKSEYLNENLDFFERMMQTDAESIPFALKELEKFSPQFDEEQNKRYRELRSQYGFSLSNIDVDRNQDLPQICVEFNSPVLAEPLQDWRQYITITPAPEDKGRYAGDRLCYSALWQHEYSVRIDPKLAANNRLELGQEETRNLNTGNSEPMLRFATRGKTLALGSDAALTVESRNVEKISVKLWQIPGNNLAGDIHDAVDSPNNISSYELGDNASLIWQGSFTPEKGAVNSVVQNRIAFADMAGKEARSGVYVLGINAGDNEYDTQFMGFSVTDQGFTAYKTDDGLWAELRDLSDNTPVVGQNVVLYAGNNRILGEVKTDRQGIARFTRAQTNGENADAPSHIISQHDNHLAYLRITGQGIDLSDKGLSGTVSNPTLTHWSWYDRGVYRPNDTFNAMWLFKTPEGKAFHDTPLWLEISRPDGIPVHSQLLEPDDSGAYRYSQKITANARLGNWKISIKLGKDGAPLVAENFLIDSIIPQQIESHLAIQASADKADIDIDADWLYGAPAADLLTDGEWRIRSADFGISHPAWKGWQIGRHDEIGADESAASVSQTIAPANTDKDGKRHITLDKLDRPFSTIPQKLDVSSNLTAPDGSLIHAQQEALLPRSTPYIALKAGEDNAQIAVINDKGDLQPAPLKWTLYRVDRNWYWYYGNDGRWQYEHNDNRLALKNGTLDAKGKSPENLDLALDNGIYVLEVQGQDPASAASIEIARGWFGDPSNNSPAAITLASDQPQYKGGDTLTLNLQAPFDGKATVKLANHDSIINNYDVELKNGKATLQIPWQAEWEQGVWLLANGWNAQTEDHNRRAVGLLWVGADLAARRFVPEIHTAENPLPEQPLTVNVHVPQADANTYVNIAVVDDGLYQLTAPSFTDPLVAFFGKKQFDISLYDTFGNIIKQTQARLAALRSGADGGDEISNSERAALSALPDLDLQLLAYWSNPIKLDADGNVNYTIPVPHYNGRLRVMAAAYNAEKIGSSEKTVTLKAPIVSELHTPRYLGADDSGSFSLRLHNTTDKTQILSVQVQADNLELQGEPIPETTLAPDESVTLRYPFRSNKAGEAHLNVAISGDYSEKLERRIPVRAPTLPQVRQQYDRLNSGTTLELKDLKAAHLSLNSGIPYDAAPYQRQLADYPLGCSEQTTSKLWGLLGASKLDLDNAHEAENRLANLAYWNGSYGLWANSTSSVWLSAYVGEALVELQNQKALLNPSQLTRLLSALKDDTRGEYKSEYSHGESYAYYVLALAGEPIRGNLLRYHLAAENNLEFSDSLDIATALALLGEYQAAGERLNALAQQTPQTVTKRYAYSSNTSIAAHNLVRLKQLEKLWQNVSNDPQNTLDVIKKLYDEQRESLAQALSHDGYLSTQELAWLVRLAIVAPQPATDLPIEINGQKTTLADLSKNEYNGNVRIGNVSAQTLWLNAQDLYTPKAMDASSAGWKMELRYENSKGEALDPAKLPNNTDINIIATLTPELEQGSNERSELLYVYPLPAGITLNPLDKNNSDTGIDKSSEQVTVQYRENRDDRHIAAFTMTGEPKPFSYTIHARTTRAGDWHAPGASLENMYHPEEHARQALQHVIVK